MNPILVNINKLKLHQITTTHSFHDDYTLKQLVMMLSFHSTHENDMYYFLMVMFLALFCISFTNMSNEVESFIERLLKCSQEQEQACKV